MTKICPPLSYDALCKMAWPRSPRLIAGTLLEALDADSKNSADAAVEVARFVLEEVKVGKLSRDDLPLFAVALAEKFGLSADGALSVYPEPWAYRVKEDEEAQNSGREDSRTPGQVIAENAAWYAESQRFDADATVFAFYNYEVEVVLTVTPNLPVYRALCVLAPSLVNAPGIV